MSNGTPTPNQGSSPQQNPPQPAPQPIRLDYDTTPLINLANAINQQTNNQQVANNDPDSPARKQAEAQEQGNRIARRSLYINAIIGGIAIVALWLSGQALRETAKASKAAEIADSLTRVALLRDSVRNIQSSIDDSIKFIKRFELDRKSADGQISTMKGTLAETKKQFEATNEPYVQIGNIAVRSFNINSPISISYTLTNLNNYPLKILELRVTTTTRPTHPDYVEDRKGLIPQDLQAINQYIIKETPDSFTYVEPIPLTGSRFINVLRKEYFLFLSGYVEYENLVTKTNRFYKFQIKIEDPAERRTKLFYYINENGDIRK